MSLGREAADGWQRRPGTSASVPWISMKEKTRLASNGTVTPRKQASGFRMRLCLCGIGLISERKATEMEPFFAQTTHIDPTAFDFRTSHQPYDGFATGCGRR